MNQAKQIKAALADDPAAAVRSFYQGSRSYNNLVFRSAVFGVQSCTFSQANNRIEGPPPSPSAPPWGGACRDERFPFARRA